MTIRKSSNSGIPFGNTAARPASPSLGQPYFNGEVGRLELYSSNGWQNIVQETPGIASVSGTYNESAGSGTLTISGTNFVDGAIAYAVGTNGTEYQATTTTYNSLVQLTVLFSNLSSAYEPYDIKITNPSNLFGLLPDAFYINNSPVWSTSAGSLGSFNEQVSISVSAVATDETSITYALAAGSTLPSGVTLNSSTGAISGTLPDVASNTTYTFTINASDGSNPVVPREFSITSLAFASGGTVTTSGSYTVRTFTATGTLYLPSSTNIEYLIVGGGGAGGSGLAGGGGAGGFRTNIGSPTTFAANSYTVTVGGGGASNPTNMTFGGDGVNSSIIGGSISLSSTGGGSGSPYPGTSAGKNGGSGGGGGGTDGIGSYSTGGTGNSGSYNPVEGYNGGRGNYWGASRHLGGGGGGAGGAGFDTPNSSNGGDGGVGRQSSINGTNTFYAAGGGGAGRNAYSAAGGAGANSIGGRGGGTNGAATAATANTGSGGGGGDYETSPGFAGGAGGSGIVIVRYLT
jgi:hypothetical protein